MFIRTSHKDFIVCFYVVTLLVNSEVRATAPATIAPINPAFVEKNFLAPFSIVPLCPASIFVTPYATPPIVAQPAIRPIFEKIANDAWREVTKL